MIFGKNFWMTPLGACGCCGHGGISVTWSHVSSWGHKAVPVIRLTGAGMWHSLSARGSVDTAGLQSPVVPWVLPSPGASRGPMEGVCPRSVAGDGAEGDDSCHSAVGFG